MAQLVVAFVARFRGVQRPMQENPRSKRRLIRAPLAVWLVTASIGALLPASASKAATETAKLLASDGAASDVFGVAVAVDGDTAVVGALFDDENGSAYVFRYDGMDWIEEAQLTASDAEAGDNFGVSVAVSADTAVVGAHRDSDAGDASGSAYVFRFNGATWVEEAKLTASDAATGDFFGHSVAVADDTVVVGAYRDDFLELNSGSAYVFRDNRTAWVEEVKLNAFDAMAGDSFGHSVAVSGDIAVVGAHFDSLPGNASGSAYVFRRTRTGWLMDAKLTASDGAVGHFFGHSVAVSGDIAVVGAHRDSDGGSFSGSAYVFRDNGTSWVEEEKLTASDAATGDQLGFSVAVADDAVVVGAVGDDDGGSDSGSAYVFGYDGTSWAQTAKLTASDAAPVDRFGYSVAVSGDTALVGAFNDDDNGFNSGSAYVYAVPEPSVWALHASALAVLAGLARRCRRRQARCGD